MRDGGNLFRVEARMIDLSKHAIERSFEPLLKPDSFLCEPLTERLSSLNSDMTFLQIFL